MIFRRLPSLAVVAAVFVLFAGVACGGGAFWVSGPEWVDKEWVLESYGIQDIPQPVIPGTNITATFISDDEIVNGSAGCNSYSASFDAVEHLGASKDVIAFSQIAMTEMACLEPEGIMEQEQHYVRALGTSERYEYQDGQLKIFYGPGEGLIFKEATD